VHLQGLYFIWMGLSKLGETPDNAVRLFWREAFVRDWWW